MSIEREDPSFQSLLEVNRSSFENLQSIYYRLYNGLRDMQDPVTWRTNNIDIRRLLGVKNADHESPSLEKYEDALDLVNALLKKTWMEHLVPEILYAVGFGELVEETTEKLDMLLMNGRHLPEPLLWNLAEEMNGDSKIAVINPVGHYADGETRIVSPAVFLRNIDHLVIMASTQASHGGSYDVLSDVMTFLTNPDVVRRVGIVDVVIPMFGGSRGHRPGQDKKIGYESLEAIVRPEKLVLQVKGILEKHEKDGFSPLPRFRFISVDIHNDELPGNKFREEGFEFINADPASELANEAYDVIEEKLLSHLPKKVVACDKGSIPRTERMARELLFNPKNNMEFVDVVYVNKERIQAGLVENVEVVKVERWWKRGDGGVNVEVLELPSKDNPSQEECVLIFFDDIFDSGNTAGGDVDEVGDIYPDLALKIFVATHPVLSKGISGLERVDVDVFIFGNTLRRTYDTKKEVRMVDMAPSIKRAILNRESE